MQLQLEMGARPVIELTLGQDRPAESALALLVALNGSGHSLCLSCLVSLYVLLGRWQRGMAVAAVTKFSPSADGHQQVRLTLLVGVGMGFLQEQLI